MSKHNLKSVLPLGVLTGSRAFNCFTKESDWDIVILESNVPDYTHLDHHCTDFTSSDDWEDSYDERKPGYRLTEFEEFDDEPFVEYDQTTIWGPLKHIVKYWDDDEVCINLFVYEDKHTIILDKFKELNNLMNFVHNVKLKDRDYRVKAFTEVISHVGITDTSY